MPARFTDSVVAAVRRRYEDTDQLVVSIAAEFGVGERTINHWIAAHGWRKRSLRTRGLPVALQLLEEAKGLAAPSAHSRESGNPGALEKEELDPRFRGDDRRERGDERENLSPIHQRSPIDRIEALVVEEIKAEETAQALRRGKRNSAKASEQSVRRLATLTQTLQTLQRMRTGVSPEHESIADDDTIPDEFAGDIDAFRRELARRIDAFVASRTDAGDGADGAASPVDEAV